MLHERYTVDDSWLAGLEGGHRSDVDVVGGPVAQSLPLTSAEWAMFLMEYAHAAPPMSDRLLSLSEAMMLPGGNISYKRRVFDMAPMQNALWEVDFHRALYRAGARFLRRNDMRAEFASPYTLNECLVERRRVSYDLAALRFRGTGKVARMLTAAAWTCLPAVLTLRTLGRAFVKPVLRQAAWRALPWVVRFSLVQTRAEIQGILSPGDSANASRSELGTDSA
jgi:hypothetical protein